MAYASDCGVKLEFNVNRKDEKPLRWPRSPPRTASHAKSLAPAKPATLLAGAVAFAVATAAAVVVAVAVAVAVVMLLLLLVLLLLLLLVVLTVSLLLLAFCVFSPPSVWGC